MYYSSLTKVFSTAIHFKLTQNENYSLKIYTVQHAFAAQNCPRCYVWKFALMVLRLAKSHGIIKSSPCYLVSMAVLCWSEAHGVVPGEMNSTTKYKKVVRGNWRKKSSRRLSPGSMENINPANKKYVNMEHFARNRKIFGDAIALIDGMGLRHAMNLHCDWNATSIYQFYATCLFHLYRSLIGGLIILRSLSEECFWCSY